MTFQVDKCRNFHQIKSVCLKCGRRMPALCKEQEEMEDKARRFDELVANGTIPVIQIETVVETATEPAEAPETVEATPVAKTRQKQPTGRRKPGRRPSK